MPKLHPDEVRSFLDEPGHLLRIATVDADGAPSVVPIWFLFRDDRLLFTPRLRSAWWAHVQREPRVAAVVDEEAGSYRKVTVRGPVEVLYPPGEDDLWRGVYRDIAVRYTPEAWADSYLQATRDEPRALLTLPCDPATATTWRMPVAGEAPEGIWASRYYVSETSGFTG